MKTLTKIMFYIPKKFLIKLIFLLFLLLSFNIYVNAASLTSYNTYYKQIVEGVQGCGTSGYYSYTTDTGDIDISTMKSGKIGSTITGRATSFYFDFDYTLNANSYYDITITSMNNDFMPRISSSMVTLKTYSSCTSAYTNNLSLISLTNNATSSNTNKLVIRVYAVNTSDFFQLGLWSTNYITSVSNFGIKSITIESVDVSGTDAIIGNNNSNTNNIINNQNQNNEELKDTINENFNSCRPSKNLFNINSTPVNTNVTTSVVENKILLVTNTNEGALSLARSTFPLSLKANTNYTITFDYTRDNSDNTYIFGVRQFSNGGNWLSNNSTIIDSGSSITINFNSGDNTSAYLWFYVKSSSTETATKTTWTFDNIMMSEGTTALPYEEYGKEVCTNKLDDTNDKLDNLNGTLNDSTPPDTQSFMEHLDDLFYDGPISTLILMPLSLINHYSDGFNSSCSPINLGKLYGTDLRLPCINLESKLGSSLWTTIDGLVSIFMIYNICMLFVSVFNDITSLRDTFDGLYVPQHGKPLGKHTSEVE